MKNILIIGSNGYIGSGLAKELTGLKKYYITGVDACWYNSPNEYTQFTTDYKNLTTEFLNKYDVVILLAGHSSVKMCECNLINSHKNNVDNFVELVNKLNTKTKFIYASSASVYGKSTNIVDETYKEFVPYNNYDITKYIIDLYIERFDIEYYGLRFGTVNGYAPVVRTDVMINSMYSSAVYNKEIKLYIKNIMRPILGIRDLVRAIDAIIDSNTDHRGLYNLASFNKTAEEIAYGVSKKLGIKITEYVLSPRQDVVNSKLETTCYDFKIDTTKFQKTFNFTFEETIDTIVDSLQNNMYLETVRNNVITYAS